MEDHIIWDMKLRDAVRKWSQEKCIAKQHVYRAVKN